MSLEKLYERVLQLEERYGLSSDGLVYSDRLLALLDTLEDEIAVEREAELKAEAEVGELEAQLNRLKALVGDAAHHEPTAGTIEEALANLEKVLGGGSDAGPTEGPGEGGADFDTFRLRVVGTNISETTLLATDYLNHFNEIVMTLEMVPMMPELLEEAKAWQPKTYQEHFRDSTFSEKDLAVEAYEHVPPKFREPFETTVEQMNQLVAATIEVLEKELEIGEAERLQHTATTNSQMLQRLIDMASGIIHGSEKTMDQSEIDAFF